MKILPHCPKIKVRIEKFYLKAQKPFQKLFCNSAADTLKIHIYVPIVSNHFLNVYTYPNKPHVVSVFSVSVVTADCYVFSLFVTVRPLKLK